MTIQLPITAPSAVPASPPAWVSDAVFYQVFPDRFANGDRSLDPEGVVDWDSTPTRGNFFGGDLAGVEQRLDHIVELGANALYLTPIFEADTNHRYDAADYTRIDHRLGDLRSFRSLVEAAHRRGIRVVLDAVFNHCGEGHWAFRSVYAHGESSPYVNWFSINGLPIVRDPEPNYATCMGCKYLPQFNHANPEVRQYLYSIAERWLAEGIDGWRLDVPFLINREFWRGFRRVVKTVNDEAYIVAEIWEEAPEWLHGDTADGTMNYPLREIVCDFASRRSSAEEFAGRLERLYAVTPDSARTSMLNLLGSHDTERMLTRFGGDMQSLRAAVALQLTSPGAPMIYYGDEIGLQGDNDPGCRGSMPWDRARWNSDILDWHRTLIAIRAQVPALRGFGDEVVFTDGGTLVRKRTDGDDVAYLVINRGDSAVTVPGAIVGTTSTDLISGATLPAGTIVVQPGGILILRPRRPR